MNDHNTEYNNSINQSKTSFSSKKNIDKSELNATFNSKILFDSCINSSSIININQSNYKEKENKNNQKHQFNANQSSMLDMSKFNERSNINEFKNDNFINYDDKEVTINKFLNIDLSIENETTKQSSSLLNDYKSNINKDILIGNMVKTSLKHFQSYPFIKQCNLNYFEKQSYLSNINKFHTFKIDKQDCLIETIGNKEVIKTICPIVTEEINEVEDIKYYPNNENYIYIHYNNYDENRENQNDENENVYEEDIRNQNYFSILKEDTTNNTTSMSRNPLIFIFPNTEFTILNCEENKYYHSNYSKNEFLEKESLILYQNISSIYEDPSSNQLLLENKNENSEQNTNDLYHQNNDSTKAPIQDSYREITYNLTTTKNFYWVLYYGKEFLNLYYKQTYEGFNTTLVIFKRLYIEIIKKLNIMFENNEFLIKNLSTKLEKHILSLIFEFRDILRIKQRIFENDLYQINSYFDNISRSLKSVIIKNKHFIDNNYLDLADDIYECLDEDLDSNYCFNTSDDLDKLYDNMYENINEDPNQTENVIESIKCIENFDNNIYLDENLRKQIINYRIDKLSKYYNIENIQNTQKFNKKKFEQISKKVNYDFLITYFKKSLNSSGLDKDVILDYKQLDNILILLIKDYSNLLDELELEILKRLYTLKKNNNKDNKKIQNVSFLVLYSFYNIPLDRDHYSMFFYLFLLNIEKKNHIYYRLFYLILKEVYQEKCIKKNEVLDKYFNSHININNINSDQVESNYNNKTQPNKQLEEISEEEKEDNNSLRGSTNNVNETTKYRIQPKILEELDQYIDLKFETNVRSRYFYKYLLDKYFI